MRRLGVALLLLFVAVLLAVGWTSADAAGGAGRVFRDCSDCPEMVVVVPRAGAPIAADAKAGAPVAIGVGRYEVTRDEYKVFAKETLEPAHFCVFPFIRDYNFHNDDLNTDHPGLGGYRLSGRDPAICVSWFEARDYVEWLSKKTGQKYRLPSDAELQYLAAAGATTRYPWGDRAADACKFANGLDVTVKSLRWTEDWSFYKDDMLPCNDGHAFMAPVGSFKPNAFGLYDTIGNVWEWTSDCVTDPSKWPAGDLYGPCVLRGGSWLSGVVGLSNRGTRRTSLSNDHDPEIGFRVIRVLSD